MTGVGELNLIELGCYAFVAYAAWVFFCLGVKVVSKLGAKLANLCKTEVHLTALPDDFGLFPGHTS